MDNTERIIEMKNGGISDQEIINNLRNEGISSKDISDSLAQAKIKMAVNQGPLENENYQESQPYAQQDTSQQEMQPASQNQQEQQYTPYTEAPQAYSNQGQDYYYQNSAPMDIEAISEVTDRLVSEKMKDINQKVKLLLEFKTKAEEDIIDLKERLKRIESNIDNLQRSVITKVGEFGQSTTIIHKDLDNLHGTVSKLMNPLVDNYNELKRFNEKNSSNN